MYTDFFGHMRDMCVKFGTVTALRGQCDVQHTFDKACSFSDVLVFVVMRVQQDDGLELFAFLSIFICFTEVLSIDI